MSESAQGANQLLGINQKGKDKMSWKPWTQEELSVLLAHANSPRKVVAKLLPGRTYISVKHRMKDILQFPGPRRKVRKSIKERFEASIVKMPNGCWEWIKSKRKGGYGKMKVNGRDEVASRVAWEIYNGPIPEGLWGLHKCDNPSCVNPDHIFLGTAKDNKEDCVKKDRHAYGEKNLGGDKLTDEDAIKIKQDPRRYEEIAKAFNVSHTMVQGIKSGYLWKHITVPATKGKNHTYGSDHYHAKLTEEQVSLIKQDKRSTKEIAKSFGVGATAICFIKTGRTWKHVLTPIYRNKIGRPRPIRRGG